MEEKNNEGKIISVTEELHNGRSMICVKLKDGRTIKNNWDGSDLGHDKEYYIRLEKAKGLIKAKKVEWTTWGNFDPNRWFDDIWEVKPD
jgi:co-chaperonin GroES (HSP10)